MGGFVLDCTDVDQPESLELDHPMSPDEFLFLLEENYINVPLITEEEIRDRSKGDVLSKALTVLQMGWFVIQSIARRIQGLPITELELATVAFALTNTVSYIFWWYKPLNVHCPVPVKLKRWIYEKDLEKCKQLVQGPQLEEESENDEGSRDSKLAYVRKWMIVLFESVRTSVPVVHEWEGHTKRKRVHRQYSGQLPHIQLLMTFLTAGLLAEMFAAIHFVAWQYSFPSQAEKFVWQVCCMIMLAVPFWLAGVFVTINMFPKFFHQTLVKIPLCRNTYYIQDAISIYDSFLLKYNQGVYLDEISNILLISAGYIAESPLKFTHTRIHIIEVMAQWWGFLREK
jgi:hypothetical protein